MLSPWMDQVVLLGGTEQDSHDDLPRKIYDYGAKGSRLHFVPDVLKTRAAHDWIIGASGGGKPELPLVALVSVVKGRVLRVERMSHSLQLRTGDRDENELVDAVQEWVADISGVAGLPAGKKGKIEKEFLRSTGKLKAHELDDHTPEDGKAKIPLHELSYDDFESKEEYHKFKKRQNAIEAEIAKNKPRPPLTPQKQKKVVRKPTVSEESMLKSRQAMEFVASASAQPSSPNPCSAHQRTHTGAVVEVCSTIGSVDGVGEKHPEHQGLEEVSLSRQRRRRETALLCAHRVL